MPYINILPFRISQQYSLLHHLIFQDCNKRCHHTSCTEKRIEISHSANVIAIFFQLKVHLHLTLAFVFFFDLCRSVLVNANVRCEHYLPLVCVFNSSLIMPPCTSLDCVYVHGVESTHHTLHL